MLAPTPNPQLVILRRELVAVEKQTVFETHRRQEVEGTLQREQRVAMQPEHAAAILRREEDIKRLQEEKQAMTEWLHRGVAEASRMSEQIIALNTAFTESKSNESQLQEDRDKLEAMSLQLQHEIEVAEGKLMSVREHRAILEGTYQNSTEVAGAANEVIANVISDKNRLESEMEFVRAKARDVQIIQVAMDCAGSAIRRTLHELQILNSRTSQGLCIEDSDSDEDFDSGDDETSTVFPPASLTSSKAHISRCDILVHTLFVCLNRYGTDQSSREQQQRKMHEDLSREMRLELQEIIDRSDYHIKKLIEENRRREPMLLQYLQIRNERMARNAIRIENSTGPIQLETFDLLKELEAENDSLEEERNVILAEHKIITAKADRAEQDYLSIREMKHLYRDLETQKTMLSHEVRSAEHEHKDMKVQLWGMGPLNPAKQAKPAAAERRSWRSVPS